jgi:hypothetical protein
MEAWKQLLRSFRDLNQEDRRSIVGAALAETPTSKDLLEILDLFWVEGLSRMSKKEMIFAQPMFSSDDFQLEPLDSDNYWENF